MELWPTKRVDPMQVAPVLPPARKGTPVPRTALLINPFYKVWNPLVHLTRLRHLRYRRRLAREGSLPGHLVSPIHPSV